MEYSVSTNNQCSFFRNFFVCALSEPKWAEVGLSEPKWAEVSLSGPK